jgi:hypothetical protein
MFLILKLCSAAQVYKDFPDKKIFPQSAFIFDPPVTLHASAGMIYPDPERRNHPVTLFPFHAEQVGMRFLKVRQQFPELFHCVIGHRHKTTGPSLQS